MNVLIFNAVLAAGVVLCAAGAWCQWGPGVGLMVAGGLMLGLTFTVALTVGRA